MIKQKKKKHRVLHKNIVSHIMNIDQVGRPVRYSSKRLTE